MVPEGGAGAVRQTSYGQARPHTPVDRLGIWLSGRAIRQHLPPLADRRIGDFGCGYRATFLETVLDEVAEAVAVDVSLADEVKAHPKVRAIEEPLPGALRHVATASLDVVLCVSTLEHLWEPLRALTEFRRTLAPGGVALVNVPSWWGKRFLELSAFRLGLSPPEEMDDHKAYYDPRDLWPLLVRAGFLPHGIRCHRHKAGMNTFAVCRVDR